LSISNKTNEKSFNRVPKHHVFFSEESHHPIRTLYVNAIAGASTKHHRRARRNVHGGPGGPGDAAGDATGGAGVGGGDRSTVRGGDNAGTVVSHSQATTGQRRDHPLLGPGSRLFYENTYRIEPQVAPIF